MKMIFAKRKYSTLSRDTMVKDKEKANLFLNSDFIVMITKAILPLTDRCEAQVYIQERALTESSKTGFKYMHVCFCVVCLFFISFPSELISQWFSSINTDKKHNTVKYQLLFEHIRQLLNVSWFLWLTYLFGYFYSTSHNCCLRILLKSFN